MTWKEATKKENCWVCAFWGYHPFDPDKYGMCRLSPSGCVLRPDAAKHRCCSKFETAAEVKKNGNV